MVKIISYYFNSDVTLWLALNFHLFIVELRAIEIEKPHAYPVDNHEE